MTLTLKLDSKSRGSLARLGGRPGQTWTATSKGPRIVLERVKTPTPVKDGKEDWVPTMTLTELRARTVIDWEPGRVRHEMVRRHTL